MTFIRKHAAMLLIMLLSAVAAAGQSPATINDVACLSASEKVIYLVSPFNEYPVSDLYAVKQTEELDLPGGNMVIGIISINGIKINGDTCDALAAIAFQAEGTSSSPFFSWNFGDPVSGINDTITLAGGNVIPFPQHTFSAPGTYTVCVSLQEPGFPVIQICRTVKIGRCCTETTSSTTNDSICQSQLPYTWNGNSYSSGGTYNVSLVNSAGCDSIATLVLTLSSNTLSPALGSDTFICAGGSLTLKPGNFSSYLWQDLSTRPQFVVTRAGRYSVTVTDAAGCTGSAAITVTETSNCRDIFFPGSFSPNGDTRNDLFGAAGNLTTVSNYLLLIYNRWGQVVFSTRNVSDRWNGTFKGRAVDAGSFTWYVAYTLAGRGQVKKTGNLVLLK